MTIFSDPEYLDLLATITEGAAARRKAATSAEYRNREAELAEHVRRVMPEQLGAEAEHAKTEAMSIDKDAARAFANWARGRDLVLPISGTTAAACIVDLLLAEDADMDRLRAAAKAITHIHSIGEWYLDQKPIRAALAFSEVIRGMAGGDDDGGTTVGNDRDNPPPPTDYEKPLPLAAAGA
jgi:hypothetical protein